MLRFSVKDVISRIEDDSTDSDSEDIDLGEGFEPLSQDGNNDSDSYDSDDYSPDSDSNEDATYNPGELDSPHDSKVGSDSDDSNNNSLIDNNGQNIHINPRQNQPHV